MARFQVRELAESRGLSVSTLLLEANRLTPTARLTYPTIHGLWHNKTQRPDLGTLGAVARALGVTVGELFVEDNGGGPIQDRDQSTRAPVSALA